MEIDLSTVTNTVAETIWNKNNAEVMGEFAQQDIMVQHVAKEKLLPIISATVPVVESSIAARMINIINLGHDLKHSPDEILMSLTFELSGVTL